MTVVEERPLESIDTASTRTMAGGSMSVASWRLAARLARREVRRRPGRTLLVALLVAIPVLAMTSGAIIVRSDTDDAAFTRSYGTADVVVSQWWYADQGAGIPDPIDFADPDLQATWPEGTASTEIVSVYTSITPADAGPVDVTAIHGNTLSANMERLIDVHSGRLPSADDEVLLHPSVAADLDVGVGDELELERPDRTVLVAGLGREIDSHRDRIMVFAELDRAELRNYRLTTLIDLPPGVDDVTFTTELLTTDSTENRDGLSVETRSGRLSENESDGRTEALAWGWVVGVLALAALGVIIAAAFATSARRQLATVGQLAANGASPRLIRRTLSLQGTWSGVVGGLVGITAGIVAFLSGRPIIEWIVGRDWTNTTVRPLDMAILLFTGTAAATVAALLPSRSLANTSVLGALAGRRPIRPVRATTVTAGAASFVAGIFLLTVAAAASTNSNDGSNNNLLALVAIIGGVCVLAGMCLAAPLAITVSTAVAGRLGATWKLAGRSLYRTRWRSAAVVTAIGVAGAFGLVAGTIAAGLDDDRIEGPTEMARNQAVIHASARGGGPGNASAIDPAAVGEVRDVLGPATESMVYGIDLDPPTDEEFRRAESQLEMEHGFVATSYDVWIADDELLDGMGLSTGDRQRLAEIGALAPRWFFPPDAFGRPVSTATIPLIGSGRTIDIEIARLENFESYNGIQGIVLTRTKADELGLGVIPTGIRFTADHDLTATERNALDAFQQGVAEPDSWLVGDEQASDLVSENRGFWISYQWVDYTPPQTLIQAGIAGATLLLVLIVVAIGLSLAAAESRDERNTLIAVGASPKTLRRRSAVSATLLAATGGALAVPTGLLPTAVVMQATDGDFTVSWVSVLAVVVVIPIAVGVVALVGSSLTQRLRPPRVIQDRVD